MNSNLDFTGMEHFWHIFDKLQHNIWPSKADWDALFNTPGYAVLTKSEFTQAFFMEKFSLAFMPARREELEHALANDTYGLLKHYLKIACNPQRVKERQRELEQTAAVWQQQAIEKCKQYLPQNTVGDAPPVSFVIFANDARGYTPIVVDVLASIDLADFLPLFMAHEFHHYYRKQLLNADYRSAGDKYDLLWVLDQIHCEGIADLIDKPSLIEQRQPFVRGYAEQVDQAPAYLQLMEQLSRQALQGELSLPKLGAALKQNLPQAGHPVGFYMAQTILERGSKDEMIAAVGNPFEFFALFHRCTQNKLLPNTTALLEHVRKVI